MALLLVAVIVVVSVLCGGYLFLKGGAPSNVPSGWTTYTQTNNDWSMNYPSSWTVSQDGSEMHFSKDNNLLVVAILVKETDTSKMIQEVLSILGNYYQNFQKLSESTCTFSEEQGMRVDYSFTYDSVPFRGFLVGVVLHRFGYAIYTEVPSNEFDKLSPIFENMISSFTISNLEGVIPYSQWSARESTHFIFHCYPNSNAAGDMDTIVSEHESGLNNITSTLGVSYSGKINFYLYPSDDILYKMTRRDSGFSIVKENEVHSLYASSEERQSVGHEMTHVITYWTIGEPSEALLGEGVAVALDQSGENLDETVSELIFTEMYVPLTSMLGDNWFEQDSFAAYKESGSFVKFLIDSYGVAKFKQLYISQNFLVALQTLYGRGLTELEDDWKTAIYSSWEEEFLE